jgi:hypothetical protein
LSTGITGEFRNTLESIKEAYGPDFRYSNLTSYTELADRIFDYDVFLIVEQEFATIENLTTVAAAWTGILPEYVVSGGIAILMDFAMSGGLYGAGQYLFNSTGLMDLNGVSDFYPSSLSTCNLVNSSDALARNVGATWSPSSGTISVFSTDGIVVVDDGTNPIVLHKIMGKGHVVYLGFDHHNRHSEHDDILANAIRLHRHIVVDNSNGPDNDFYTDYEDFSADLVSLGFAVSSMDTWDEALILASEMMILSTGSIAYSESKVNLLDEYVHEGGGIYIATEVTTLGDEMDPVTERFGFARNSSGLLSDPDDAFGSDMQFALDAPENVANHSATLDVYSYKLYGGGWFYEIPANAFPLLVTDTDDSTTLNGEVDILNGVPISVAATVGAGRVIATVDYTALDDVYYNEADNYIFLQNCIRWLSAAGIEEQVVLVDESHSPLFSLNSNYLEFGYLLTENGFTTRWMSTFYDTLIAETDVLMVTNGAYTTINYTASQVSAIVGYVAGGGGLFLLNDWDIHSIQTANITEAFGISVNGTSYLQDSDETVVFNSYNRYGPENILEHPITSGVSYVELDRSPAFESIGTATPLIVTDDDGTSTWFHDNSPADELVVAAASEHAMGRVVVIPDLEICLNSNDVDGDGLGQVYAADNEIFLRNAFIWLSANRAPMVEVSSPNGGEILEGEVQISWSAVDYDGDTMHFIVLYSDNGGSSWTALADGLTTTTIDWNTSTVADGEQYLIRVVAEDGRYERSDDSDAVFSIDNIDETTPPEGFPLDATMIIIIAAIGAVVLIVVVLILKRRGSE